MGICRHGHHTRIVADRLESRREQRAGARRYRRAPSRRSTTIAMSSRGAPIARSSAARSMACAISAAGRRDPRTPRTSSLDRPARGPGVEDAVGVQQQRVARLERHLVRADVEAGEQAERAAADVERLSGAVGAHEHGRRVAGRADRQDGVHRVEVEAAGDRRHVALARSVAGLIAEDRLVEARHQPLRRAVEDRRRAQRVARERGEGRRLGALAADVAEDDDPARRSALGRRRRSRRRRSSPSPAAR